MMEYVCIKDLYMYDGDRAFTESKRYTNIYKGSKPHLEFIDDSGTLHEVSDGTDFDDENWLECFVKLQDYGDYLIDESKKCNEGIFTWHTMSAPKAPSMSKEELLAHFIQNGVINIEEYLLLYDKSYADVVSYIFKKSNKEMELKVEKEKVIEASKVSKEAKKVLEKLFPEVFKPYYRIGQRLKLGFKGNFAASQEEYILARINHDVVGFINLTNGNRFGEGVRVPNIFNIEEDVIKELIGPNYTYELIK